MARQKLLGGVIDSSTPPLCWLLISCCCVQGSDGKCQVLQWMMWRWFYDFFVDSEKCTRTEREEMKQSLISQSCRRGTIEQWIRDRWYNNIVLRSNTIHLSMWVFRCLWGCRLMSVQQENAWPILLTKSTQMWRVESELTTNCTNDREEDERRELSYS